MRTYFSVFSGVEGFGLGLGDEWSPVGFSEVDKYASYVLKYHYPKTKNYGDISRIEWNNVPDFDLLTGGSPCQDFSIAGKRRGLKGSRSSLAWEFIRALRSKRPRYFIWENVKGVLSSRSGWDFANLICAFSESGYSLWWQVLNAKDFGVPQNRERIFVIGFREGSPKEVFFESQDSEKIEIVGSTKPEGSSRIGQRDRTFSMGGIMSSLEATAYKQPPQILVQNKGESQHYRLYDVEGLAPTLQSQSGMSSQKHPFIKIPSANKRGYEVAEEGDSIRLAHIGSKTGRGRVGKKKSQTLTLGGDMHTVQRSQVRRLLPIECERLMSWPDNHTKFGVNEKGETIEISDSQRYKMAGNGVVSNVVREIAKDILQ